jgi:hypothetical protein
MKQDRMLTGPSLHVARGCARETEDAVALLFLGKRPLLSALGAVHRLPMLFDAAAAESALIGLAKAALDLADFAGAGWSVLQQQLPAIRASVPLLFAGLPIFGGLGSIVEVHFAVLAQHQCQVLTTVGTHVLAARDFREVRRLFALCAVHHRRIKGRHSSL